MLAVCLSSTLNAALVQGNETSVPFGNLDQNAKDAQNNFLVDCHSGACAPVSVVNAWVYLQGAFPNIYKDNKMLIGTATNQIQQSDLVRDRFRHRHRQGDRPFVDPLGGQAKDVNITGLSLGNLNTDYSGGASIRAVYVEAPVPECSTMLMMAGGLFLISICVKMATSA